jgi:hypothetical protein
MGVKLGLPYKLRMIFRPQRDEEPGDWRKLHKEEFHDLYTSLDIIRMIKNKKNEIQIFRGKN